MKKLILAAYSLLTLAATSCTEEEKSFPPATVEIQNVVPQDVSVQFELVHTNAVSVGYRVETTENAGKQEFTVINTSDLKKIVCDGLTQETDYQITAVAYNADNVATEAVEKEFRTGKFTPFGEISSVATAHGIFIKTTVDTYKYPMYFLQVFDPLQTYTSGDSSEQFNVDSKDQFIHYLKTAILNPDIRKNSFQEWNKTMLSSKSKKLHLYAVPIVQDGAGFVCKDYGMIVEQILDIPENDIFGQSDVAIIPGEINITEDILTCTLAKQGEPVAFYTGLALKSDVDAAGGIGAYTQKELDAKKFDYNITSIANFREEIEIRDLSPGTDYVFFTFAYDANGKLGNVHSKEFSTTAKLEYKTDISVEVALKEVAFTSAVFSVKRTNFKNGKYNFVTIKDFDEKYGSDVDTYVMQELIGGQSGYPKSLYSDNDIKESRLQYNTEYIMIVLPESDLKDGYGQPATVRFRTKVYEETSNVSVSLKVNKIESFYGVSFYANVTITPSENCAGYYTYMMEKSVFESVSNLGEAVCKSPNLAYRIASDAQTFNTEYFFGPSYLVIIPVDKDGKFGAPVHSELLQQTL